MSEILPDWISDESLQVMYDQTEVKASYLIEYMELIQRTLADRALRGMEHGETSE